MLVILAILVIGGVFVTCVAGWLDGIVLPRAYVKSNMLRRQVVFRATLRRYPVEAAVLFVMFIIAGYFWIVARA